MTNDFKRRLRAYERGELEGKDLEAFEKELEKLEHLHDLLDTDDTEQRIETKIDNDFQRKILRRGKWRARIQTTFSVIALFVIVTIVSSILTALYYQWGSNRAETYRDVIEYSKTLTDPYGYLNISDSHVNTFFHMTVKSSLRKQIGDEIITVGEQKVNFILSLMGNPKNTYFGKTTQDEPVFFFPEQTNNLFESDWDRLEKLPKETVTSAYLSFDQLVTTETVLDYIKDRELDLLWLAVDTGLENLENDLTIVDIPFGFPRYPIWHDDDMTLDYREETKGFLGSGTVSESYSSPDYDPDDAKLLQEQFLKTAYFLEKYESKVNKLFFGELKLSERIDYIEKNGVNHYGIVITGPTKEILALKDEPWVNVMQIDEVELWNWQNFDE